MQRGQDSSTGQFDIIIPILHPTDFTGSLPLGVKPVLITVSCQICPVFGPLLVTSLGGFPRAFVPEV